MCLKGLALAHVIPDWTGDLTVVGCFTMYSILYFCIGPELVKSEKWPLSRCFVWMGIGWALVIAECVIYTNMYQAVWDGVNSAFPTVGAGMLEIGVFKLAHHIPDTCGHKLLRWAGEGILAVYVLHLAIIPVFTRVIQVRFHNIMICALVTCLICAVCILIQKAAKRVPCLNWLFRI